MRLVLLVLGATGEQYAAYVLSYISVPDATTTIGYNAEVDWNSMKSRIGDDIQCEEFFHAAVGHSRVVRYRRISCKYSILVVPERCTRQTPVCLEFHSHLTVFRRFNDDNVVFQMALTFRLAQ